MKALVTGAGGFAGSHLVDHLVKAGWSVRALVHHRGDGSIGHLAASPVQREIEIIAGDVRDRGLIRRAADGVGVIFNLAAQAGLTYSFEAPDHHFSVNAGGCLSVLHAARQTGARVVQMSTSEIYGTARRVPIDEDHPLSARSPYAASKAAADQLCEAFRHSYGADVRVARCFNVYGPRQSRRAVIPFVLATIAEAEGGDPVQVPLGVPEATRDFTYVEDTVRALRLIADHPSPPDGPINVGSGREIRLSEVVTICGCAVGRSAIADRSAHRPADAEVLRLCADSSRMHTMTGWTPQTTLEDGIARTRDWMHAHGAHG